jgi:hypothetical protein
MDLFPVPRLTFGRWLLFEIPLHAPQRKKEETRSFLGLTAFGMLLQSVLFKGRSGLE